MTHSHDVAGEGLLPCPNPWCGHIPTDMPVFLKREGWRVYCDACKLSAPRCGTAAEAVAAWNTRPTPPEQQPTSGGDGVREAAQAVVDNAQRSFRSRGRDRYIEDESGECMMLVPHEDWFRLQHSLAASPAPVTPARSEAEVRIAREQYPEIIQAARWMDENHGTPHFEPGRGFIVDDPDGLLVPVRWQPHLDLIEQALAGLDHENPHSLDVDNLRVLAESGEAPSIFNSAAYCFISGEHTPMTAMATSSRELWVASRFFNERFEGWEFDPAAGCEAALAASPAPVAPARSEAEMKAAVTALQAVADAASFLIDRIGELEWDEWEVFQRDWYGHVDPPLVRLKWALNALPPEAQSQGAGA